MFLNQPKTFLSVAPRKQAWERWSKSGKLILKFVLTFVSFMHD
jgi:hypothetical protein